MFRGIVVLCLIVVWGTTSFAQLDQTWRYYYPEFKDDAGDNLYFRLENNNFVKNNEYFSDYTEGYTMMGYTVQPSMVYYAGSRLRLKAGVHIIQYSGMDEFTEVLPTFSIHTKLTDKLELIMGGLQGDVHHKLIEPIFNPENQYTRPIENGFQFLYNSNKLWLDAWVDWEQFIFLGDTKPEKFTAGISTEFDLTKESSDFKISIPGQMVATHLGGQISNYSERMQSLANLVTGLKVNYKIGDGFIRDIGVSTYLASYHDLTGHSGWDFTSGNAIYPVAELNYKYGTLMAGYWKAHNFLAPKGSSIFQSTSDYKNGYYTEYRNLVTSKLSFSKTFMKQIKFSTVVELYYDSPAKQLDYSYGFNLVFTPNFLITNIKFD
ncbi:hypothetical protein [Carboxylicivirga sp. M1479]|uniref:hypothetical protein n=1 Tax=Carboxylicivirga sp. M1479 TaxID=2594476 RepID=UPI0011773BDD|nr:hypothetical protein [Carboxylicivirga sp. M1479]TRX71185.1 hypothetical protein FNN09_08205 [Carboxylicivirga sp. M1479]